MKRTERCACSSASVRSACTYKVVTYMRWSLPQHQALEYVPKLPSPMANGQRPTLTLGQHGKGRSPRAATFRPAITRALTCTRLMCPPHNLTSAARCNMPPPLFHARYDGPMGLPLLGAGRARGWPFPCVYIRAAVVLLLLLAGMYGTLLYYP